MRIVIFGLGYVGLTAAVCLAKEGHSILGVDISEAKVASINEGRSTIEEPGVSELLQSAVNKNLLRATTDCSRELHSHDMAIVCVGTPSAPDGSHNLSHIAEVTRQIAVAVAARGKSRLTVVYRSTIRPGTVETIIRPIFQSVLKDKFEILVELVYNPEFLREAQSIADFFAPPKIVCGTIDAKPSKALDEMNKNICAPVFYTHFREAEFTKFVDNTFHALKICFGNEIGRLSLEIGIDPSTVYNIFVADTKLNISSLYFRPGGAFGGSCLPKDVRALQYISMDTGVRTQVIESIIQSNEAHKLYVYKYVTKGIAPGAKVLLLGLAFKFNSDDLRESPKVDLARSLLRNGYKLSIYDPGLKIDRLMGANLGYGASHFPELFQLLIEQEQAEAEAFDVVIDASGIAELLKLNCGRVVDINTLSDQG